MCAQRLVLAGRDHGSQSKPHSTAVGPKDASREQQWCLPCPPDGGANYCHYENLVADLRPLPDALLKRPDRVVQETPCSGGNPSIDELGPELEGRSFRSSWTAINQRPHRPEASHFQAKESQVTRINRPQLRRGRLTPCSSRHGITGGREAHIYSDREASPTDIFCNVGANDDRHFGNY